MALEQGLKGDRNKEGREELFASRRNHEGEGMRVRSSLMWGEEVSEGKAASHRTQCVDPSGRGRRPGDVQSPLQLSYPVTQPLQSLRPLVSKMRHRQLPGDLTDGSERDVKPCTCEHFVKLGGSAALGSDLITGPL